MRLYKFNNDVCVDLDKIESVSQPILADPYQKTYGPMYVITMASGQTFDCYEFVSAESMKNPPTYGRIVMPRDNLLNLLIHIGE